jgi:uncharacterized damage-inducible protein DinB
LIDTLRDLWAHQAWADALLWRAVLACPAAHDDAFLLDHRGQNARRLRELGGEPPTTDLIVWIAAGRPPPDWS